jgi:hypothetical protein
MNNKFTDEQRTTIRSAWQRFNKSLARVEQLEEPGEHEYDPNTDGLDDRGDQDQELEDAEILGCPYKSECYGYYNSCESHLCTQVNMDDVDDEICFPDTPGMRAWFMQWLASDARKAFCNLSVPKDKQAMSSTTPTPAQAASAPTESASTALLTPAEA